MEEVTHDLKLRVAKSMIKYGGSFVSALGEALIHADPDNTLKIKKAFSLYWKSYEKMGAGDE